MNARSVKNFGLIAALGIVGTVLSGCKPDSVTSERQVAAYENGQPAFIREISFEDGTKAKVYVMEQDGHHLYIIRSNENIETSYTRSCGKNCRETIRSSNQE